MLRGGEEASLESREYARIFPVGRKDTDSVESWIAAEIANSPTVERLPAMIGRKFPFRYLAGIAVLLVVWIIWRRWNRVDRPAR
jgi:hypothetical protein